MVALGAPATATLDVCVLGPVRARYAGRELALGPPRQRAVLAFLAVRADQAVSRDELVDAIWGDTPPASAANSVHVYVSGLRRVLEPDLLPRAGSGYRLRLDPDRLDLRIFHDHLDAARAVADHDPGAAVAALDAALALWQPPALAGIPGPWARGQRDRWAELRLAAAEDRAEAMLRLRPGGDVVAQLSQLAEEYPLRERVRALLMTALCLVGRQADALAVYADTRRVLVEDLGIEPGPALRELHRRILGGDRVELRPARPTSPAPVPRQLPAPVPRFVGRTAELAALTEAARDAGAVVVSAIEGTAGIGKTALAVHWAHRVADRYPDGQLYVNLRGFDPGGVPVEPAAAIGGFLDALGVPARQRPAAPESQAALYRTMLADKRMLVVLDNARDADQVRPLLPGGRGCLALVTSRHQLGGLVASDAARVVTLDLLPPADSGTLLRDRVGTARACAEPEALDAIVARCNGLPLALAVVAARAATRPGVGLATLARELSDSGLDQLSAGDPRTDVRAVLSWSYRALSEPAARLFRLLGLHPGPDVSTAAAASLAGLPPTGVRPLLDELVHAHLVEEHAPGRYTSHDLLRAYAAELARDTEPQDARRAALHRLLDHYLHTGRRAAVLVYPIRQPPDVPPPRPGTHPEPLADRAEALAWFEAEDAVLLGIPRLAVGSGFPAYTWPLVWNMTGFLERRWRWHEHAPVQRAALAASLDAVEPAARAGALRTLALTCRRLGRFDEGLGYLRQADDLCAAVGDLAGRAHCQLSIGHAWENAGRIPEALDAARRSLELAEAADAPRQRALALNSVGWYESILGQPGQGLVHCTAAVELIRELGDRRALASVLDSLGYAHHGLGQYDAATARYREAVALAHELGDRLTEAKVLDRLAHNHVDAGEREAARECWGRALALFERLDPRAADEVWARLRALD